jgi:hypothetical protein
MQQQQAIQRPGAYAVTKTGQRPEQVVRVIVPASVQPGMEFMVQLDDRSVKVRCPMNSGPGQQLQITMPPEPMLKTNYLRMAPLTPASEAAAAASTTPAKKKEPQAYLVTIPPTIYPGMQFKVDINGQRFQLTCPPNVGPNMKVKIVPPIQETPQEKQQRLRQQQETPATKGTTCGWDDNVALGDALTDDAKTQMFEVIVPPGVKPGQPFALKANGQRVLVTCPNNVRSGQKIRFQIPVTQTMVQHIQLNYDTNDTTNDTTNRGEQPTSTTKQAGWSRTIRVSDLKFQWARVDNNEANDEQSGGDNNHSSPINANKSTRYLLDTAGMEKFDFQKSAYCRQLTFYPGSDSRLRTGRLDWIPAQQAVVDGRVAYQGQVLVSYAELAEIQSASNLSTKLAWWEEKICNPLLFNYEQGGFIRMVVRRQFLLVDSIRAIMSLSREEMRKKWRLEFVGERGLDAGGVTREWFQLITEELYDPAFGMWHHPTQQQQGVVSIHPNSAINCPEEHLVCFRVLGRILGRALLDRQLIHRGGHMARFLYKHLLGFPITFDDLSTLDHEYFKSLQQLVDMGESINDACLDFTVTEDQLGAKKEIELIPDGANTEVTTDNLGDFLEACLRYRMMDRIQEQLTELLLGFFDVVPEPALTIFDCNELELVLCGLPTIDMEDWQTHTAYDGVFSKSGPGHPVVKWFWEVVSEDFDAELHARLLQFVTGTSGVPSRGFSALQGNDGNIRWFTLYGTDPRNSKSDVSHDYPRSQ